jgi:hypothetical protein
MGEVESILDTLNEMSEHTSERFQFTERDLLIKLSTEFKAFAETVRINQVSLQSQHNDHEKRLRTLENFRWWIVGGAASAGFFGSLLARVIWPR